jgi:hypothetical protein
MYNYQQQYEDEQRRLALLPTITSTVLITVFFGLFGLIPAVSNTNRARALGVQTSKYWKAFGVTMAAVLVGWVLIFAAAGSSSSTGYTGAVGVPAGHHYGWDQPRNPHHQPPCSVVFHVGCASVNPPPTQVTWTNPPPNPR